MGLDDRLHDRQAESEAAGLVELRARSPRTKGWSMASRSASGIPGPESRMQTRTPRSDASIWTSARPPYFTALSTRLVTARWSSSGLPWTRTCRLRLTLTGDPKSEKSSQTVWTTDARSTRLWLFASRIWPSRTKESAASTRPFIWSRSRRVEARACSSSMNSARRRSRVIGVRRSWLIAASICVRSSIRRRTRDRIRSSARDTASTSRGPASGSATWSSRAPNASAAPASRFSGAVRARVAQTQSSARVSARKTTVKISAPWRAPGGDRSAASPGAARPPA